MDEILNLIESVSEGLPSYFYNVTTVKVHSLNDTLWETFENIHLNKLSFEIQTISKTSDLVSCHKLRFVLLQNSNNKSVQ